VRVLLTERNQHPAGQGFDQPFEMLSTCHEKVERMLALLERLTLHLREQGADDAAQDAARDVMRYFDLAAPLHHEDEELHVLPLLLQSGDAALVALAQQLHAEHLAMTQVWSALRKDLARLLDKGGEQPPSSSLSPWLSHGPEFAALYRRHLQAEESLAYPHAQARISDAARDSMRVDMMVRRGHPRPGT